MYKTGKTDTNLCTFCHKEGETLINFFLLMYPYHLFRVLGILWIREKTNQSTAMDNNIFLFGNTDVTCDSKVVNLILLNCRFHEYKMKMNEKRLSISVLKEDVKNYMYYLMEKKSCFMELEAAPNFTRNGTN